jgi:hypothetical protein
MKSIRLIEIKKQGQALNLGYLQSETIVTIYGFGFGFGTIWKKIVLEKSNSRKVGVYSPLIQKNM